MMDEYCLDSRLEVRDYLLQRGTQRGSDGNNEVGSMRSGLRGHVDARMDL